MNIRTKHRHYCMPSSFSIPEMFSTYTYLPENEDGEMYLLVLAHPACPGHTPESHKTVVVVLTYLLYHDHERKAAN